MQWPTYYSLKVHGIAPTSVARCMHAWQCQESCVQSVRQKGNEGQSKWCALINRAGVCNLDWECANLISSEQWFRITTGQGRLNSSVRAVVTSPLCAYMHHNRRREGRGSAGSKMHAHTKTGEHDRTDSAVQHALSNWTHKSRRSPRRPQLLPMPQ